MSQTKKILIIVMLLATFANLVKGQELLIEQIAEDIASIQETEVDLSELIENLEYYYENPLNLNTCTETHLQQLLILSDFQIKSLLAYRSRVPFVSVYELPTIEGFSLPLVKLILPFISIGKSEIDKSWSFKKAFKYGKNEIFLRTIGNLENSTGYTKLSEKEQQENPNSYYPGNKFRYYTRYKFNYKKKIQWGITMEKDPGEQFFAGTQKQGFDFYSAHLQINDLGIFKTTVIGDYQVKLGQGLIMWSYLTQNKTSSVLNIRKSNRGLKKYSSTDENQFLRGAGTTLAFKNFEFTIFGSHKNFDGTLTQIDSNNWVATGIDIAGIHATPNQLNKKDALSENLAGGNINYSHKWFSMGLSGMYHKFEHKFIADTSGYDVYNFNGDNNFNLSTDIELKFKSIHFFSEAALSKNGGKAILAGAVLQLTSQIGAAVLYRNYSIDYQTVYGNAFVENSRVQNEKGIYAGVEMHPIKKIKLSAFYDFFSSPWLKHRVYSPSKGSQYFVQIDYATTRNMSMYARISNKVKPYNQTSDSIELIQIADNKKLDIKYNLAYSPNKKWRISTRVNFTKYQAADKQPEYGYLLYQDIRCSPFQFPLQISFRYAMFETDSYNSRIYAYESDLLYVYSIPAYYMKGTKAYLMANYSINKRIDIWLRYSRIWYANTSSIGSGLNEIEGDSKSEIKAQLRIKL